jgi:TctA family transporter
VQACEQANFDDVRAWEGALEGAATRLGPGLPPAQLAALLQHLGRLSFASWSSGLASSLMPCLVASAGQLSTADLAGSLWAAAKVGCWGTGWAAALQSTRGHPVPAASVHARLQS